MSDSRVVILDSSGIISLVKSDDALHDDALAIADIIESNGWQVILPFEILSETINIIGKVLGKKDAIKTANSILEQNDAQTLSFVNTKAHIVSKAINTLSSAKGSPSFTDCLVMAQADNIDTKYVFGFDAAFKKNGYLPPTKKF